MSDGLILITGAAGKTGSATIERLLAGGHAVRAMVRVDDERSERLRALGAEVVVGDFLDLASVRSALDGVSRAYLCYPPQGAHLVDATAVFAIAASDAGVDTVVNMSQLPAREDAPSMLSRQHWQAERVLDWAGVGAVHIAATFFVENLFMLGAHSIAEEGRVYFPYGAERHAPVSAADLARVIAAILAQPGAHRGKRYAITGPELLTLDEMASALSDGLGTDVSYVDLPREAWLGALEGVPTMSPSLIAHLGHVADDHRAGVFAVRNDLVEAITGTPAEPIGASIARIAPAFGFEAASV